MMRTGAFAVLLFLLAYTGAARAAQAVVDPDAATCAEQLANADDRIAACSRLIDSGTQSSEALVSVYVSRGLAHARNREYERAIADYDAAIKVNARNPAAFYARGAAWAYKGEYDRAIADYSEAIKLNPKYHFAYLGRGNVWTLKSDYKNALADYDEALRLNPQYARAFRGRAYARFMLGSYADASKDFSEHIRLRPVDVDSRIWRYMAQVRATDEATARDALRESSATIDLKEWPGPAVDFQLGVIDAAALLKAAAHADPNTRSERECLAHFYIAEAQLRMKGAAAAHTRLEQAQICPKVFYEHDAAAFAEMTRRASAE